MTARWILIAALGLLAPAAHGQAPSAPASVRWHRDRANPRWVAGEVAVAASPDAVWRRVQQVDAWRAIFSDIRSLQVRQRDGGHWVVRLETRTFNCGAHDYHVRTLAGRALESRIDAPGVNALARLVVRDGPAPGQAVVGYSLFVEATGVIGWFVNQDDLRRKQEQMAERYLADLQRAFGAVAR